MLEEEYGEYKLPASELLKIKKNLNNVWCRYVDDCYQAATEILDATVTVGVTTVSQDWLSTSMKLACIRHRLPVSILKGDSESPLQKFLQKNGRGQFNYCTEKHAKEMKLAKSVSITKLTYQCTLGNLTLNSDSKIVTWNVCTDINAVELAKEHPIAAEFFKQLSQIRWTDRYGGFCRYINDALRIDKDGLGFHFTHCFGSERDRALIRI